MTPTQITEAQRLADASKNLPPLPAPLVMVNRYGIGASTSDGEGGVFTAEQMQAYALAAQAAQAQQPMTEDQITRHIGADEGDREAVTAIVREVEAWHGIGTAGTQIAALPYLGPWCCADGQRLAVPVCPECADTSAAYQEAMQQEPKS